MSGLLDTAHIDGPTETSPASELELTKDGHEDLAWISDELTDALQAATYYVEAVRKIATGRDPVVDRRDRDILVLAMKQIARANRAVKRLHGTLSVRQE